MQKVEYKFADGTESAVEVSDELHAVIEALEKEEKRLRSDKIKQGRKFKEKIKK